MFGPRIFVRYKGGYVPPGGRTSLTQRVPRKLRPGEVRPAIYYKFDQRVELSDGSTISRRTTFPRVEWKYLSDQRNQQLWNPSQTDLRALELDASGRLARFRKKFAGFDENENKTEEASMDLEDLMSEGAEQITTGRLHVEKKKEKKRR